MKFWLRNVGLHVGSAIVPALPIVTDYFLNPTGGFEQFLKDHPAYGAAWFVGTLIVREGLKLVPKLAPQTATPVGPNAPAALNTADVKS